MSKLKFAPTPMRIWITPDKPQRTDTDIALPNVTQRGKPVAWFNGMATVLAVGPGRLNDNGSRADQVCKEGDRILCLLSPDNEFHPERITDSIFMIDEDQVVAVVTGEEFEPKHPTDLVSEANASDSRPSV